MITLASDFGWPYPAAMRGVICRRTDARMVDVTHQLPRQDVRAAAFWLREVLPWFPPAVHLAVVDPGVGTDRAPLVLRAGDHLLVGPDNGSLVPPARALAALADDAAGAAVAPHGYSRPTRDADGDADSNAGADGGGDATGDGGRDPGPAADDDPALDDRIDAFRIEVDDPRSSTFHGRDVFAPAAADLHEVGAERLDRVVPVDDFEDLRLPTPDVSEDRVVGEVLVVDEFGNAVTNVPGAAVDGLSAVHVEAGHTDDRVPVVETFAAVDPGDRLVTVGSHGNVELDVNRGRGDEAFGVALGDRVVLRR